MSVIKAKKYSYTALGLALFSFLLLTLSGCDTTSDPKVHYQATGSWQGKIKNPVSGTVDQVRGIIAPDGTYHLAIVDAAGNSVGEYVGAIDTINPDNIGSMSRTRLQAGVSSGPLPPATFILSANQLKSDQGIALTRTVEANGPADQDDVKGHWSLSALDNTTEVVIDADGILNGNDGFCNYSGSLKLQSPAWNIYSLDVTTSDTTYLSCSLDKGTYSGLAMRLNTGDPRPHLWFAANSGAKTFLGEWSETENIAPVAAMTIRGERENGSVLVQLDIGAEVELDAQHSTDANNDSLTYEWSVTYPGGNSVIRTGSTATFVPDSTGLYSLTLTVSDGIVFDDPLTRSVNVVRTEKRFIPRKDPVHGDTGTVLDTKTQLIWLKDAGCLALNLLEGADGQWGANTDNAVAGVAALHADESGSESVCGLKDGSAAGDWDVPTLKEFRGIMAVIPYDHPPALLNDAGTGLWEGGSDSFANVGKTNNLIIPSYYYWAKEEAPTTWFYINFSYIDPEKWYSSDVLGYPNNFNTVWPVRVLRVGESDLSGL